VVITGGRHSSLGRGSPGGDVLQLWGDVVASGRCGSLGACGSSKEREALGSVVAVGDIVEPLGNVITLGGCYSS
jgi:hypothetical protein